MAVPQNSLGAQPTSRSHSGERLDAVGAGRATLGRQHHGDRRVDRRKEVRCLRPMGAEHAVPLIVRARAALPLVSLLSALDAVIWQENRPQLGPAVDTRHAPRRPPAGARPRPPTSRCRYGCRKLLAAALSLATAALCVSARVVLIGRASLNFGGRAARAAALMEGLTHRHDAGWVGGAGRTEEDQCPVLWCAW